MDADLYTAAVTAAPTDILYVNCGWCSDVQSTTENPVAVILSIEITFYA